MYQMLVGKIACISLRRDVGLELSDSFRLLPLPPPFNRRTDTWRPLWMAPTIGALSCACLIKDGSENHPKMSRGEIMAC